MAYTYCYEKEDLVYTKTGGEWIVRESQGYRRRYGVLQVTEGSISLLHRKKSELLTPRHSHTPFLILTVIGARASYNSSFSDVGSGFEIPGKAGESL